MSYYCNVYPPDTLWPYKYVVVLSRYQGKYLLSRHKKRTTWETQGGHIEPGETPLQAAKRELFEESGALRYQIEPLFDCRAEDAHGEANGVVFLAEIEEPLVEFDEGLMRDTVREISINKQGEMTVTLLGGLSFTEKL